MIRIPLIIAACLALAACAKPVESSHQLPPPDEAASPKAPSFEVVQSAQTSDYVATYAVRDVEHGCQYVVVSSNVGTAIYPRMQALAGDNVNRAQVC